MASNFSFLTLNKKFESFAGACLEAERSLGVSPATSAILTRRALELAVKWIYSFDSDLKVPYRDNISTLIHDESFKDVIEPKLFPLIKYIIKLGNNAVHTSDKVKRAEAVLALRNLHQFVSWVDYCYSEECHETVFAEEILPTGKEKKVKQEDLAKLFHALGAKDKKLKDIASENQKLREELKLLRETNATKQQFKVDEISEFETRKRYIDLDLRDVGWSFGENCIEEFEVDGMPSPSGKGFVDYVLFGDNGKPLAVVEAKRTSKDANEGKQQAKLYADCLAKRFGQRPIIFYTNGFETFIWDDTFSPARCVCGFYSKDELQLSVDRRTDRLPLDEITIKNEISNRYYQKEAIKAVCESFQKGNRKALLVMATGSGKTRTAISIVDVLSRHGWVKNVLFLADRTALVKQAKDTFNYSLPNMSLCNLLVKDNPNSRIVFSTYPTMMNAIDDTRSEDGQKLFTVGHFDLIIVDESHRSIYKKYQAIFQYFDALLIGLTATPKDDIDKNTYEVFDLENNIPTYAYELTQAVEDGYLVDFHSVETKLKFLEEGIYYDELSEEEKEMFEETFDDDEEMPDFISSEQLNTWLYNSDTIDKVIAKLMEKGLKVEGGDKLGKTIIFAKNHKHAEKIVERFDKAYPLYGGNFAKIIDYREQYAQDMIEDFGQKDKMPQIAVSVDMLDTGIDIHEIVNLVFFKKVMSKSKFWQMIGRGTRLCEDLFGIGQDKKYFLVFDFCGNFEFFAVNPKGIEVKATEGLTEKIFNTKIELIKELQHLKLQEEKYIQYRTRLVKEVLAEINQLDKESFVVKQHLRYIEHFTNLDAWISLGVIDVADLKAYIAPLIISNDEDELAKRFDHLMFSIELAELLGQKATKAKGNVINTAKKLSTIATIPQVREQKDVIEKVLKENFWLTANIFEYEAVREALRDLIKFIEKEDRKIYYTNFTDEILSVKENQATYIVNNLEDYKERVNAYIREHQNHISIYKLKNNMPLLPEDFLELERIMWGEVGTKEEYRKEFGETPLTILVRQVVGLDQRAANEAFSEFLNSGNLDSKQIRYVKMIVEYVVKNGIMDKKILQEEPFKSVGSVIEIFPTEKVMKIVNIIEKINTNATTVLGA